MFVNNVKFFSMLFMGRLNILQVHLYTDFCVLDCEMSDQLRACESFSVTFGLKSGTQFFFSFLKLLS